MKKIILITFIFLSTIFSQINLEDLLNDISKDSPQYKLNTALIKQIKKLNFKKERVKIDIKNQNEAVETFLKLVELQQELSNLPNQIKDLNKKINLLKIKTDATSKLQLLYYQKKLSILNQKLLFLNQNLPIWKKNLYKNIKKIDFNTKIANENIKRLKNFLLDREKELETLKINLQRWEILGEKTNIENIKKFIDKNIKTQKEIYKKLIRNYLTIWFYQLKAKDKKALKTAKKIYEYAKNIDSNLANEIDILMKDFEKFSFGKTLLFYELKENFYYFLKKISNYLNYPIFHLKSSIITPLDFVKLIFLLFIGFYLGKFYKKFIYKLKRKYENFPTSTATLLANMGYYIIIILFFLIALNSIGLNLSSLALIAGALSVGIGFGLQNIVSNFVSGIIMMFEESIKVGDYIEVNENIRGEVIDIFMRSTVIRTNDNINLIIPNQTFIQNSVINWTMSDDIVRFKVPFSVAYGSDIEKMSKILIDELKNSDMPFVRSKDFEPIVVFKEMGDSSLNFELFVWVRGKYARMPRITKSIFLRFIYKILNSHNIEIPFPQRDLHFKNPLEVEIKK